MKLRRDYRFCCEWCDKLILTKQLLDPYKPYYCSSACETANGLAEYISRHMTDPTPDAFFLIGLEERKNE